MRKKAKNLIVQALKVVLALGLIIWLVQSGKLNFKALANLLQPQYLAAGFCLIFANMYLTSERWRMLLQTQDHHQNSWQTFKLTMIGIFFNFAVPGGVGGDLVKAFYFTKDHPESKMIAATSVLMDRVLGLYAMILMALFAMLLDWNHVQDHPTLRLLWTAILILFVVATMGLGMIFSQKLYDRGSFKRLLLKLPGNSKTTRIYESLHMYGRNYKYLIASVIISLLAQTFSILFMILAGTASGLGAEMKWQTYFLVAPLGFMATAVPISPAGVGVGQAAFYFLFNIYTGHPTDLGPTTITALQVAQFLSGLLGAYFYMQRKERVPEKVSQN
ncbi:lysylphosphatidylglycerol synthase transmembrane domain-containing protein [Bdellovibrio sp. HCB337]|uniref:lysylphosphatidylglycerol synthase transmembrane domain-containing protein n=1 Tax=Bdellovibrio sp. HCB337 TaxID=3394358 RepID=UPI0039A720ED